MNNVFERKTVKSLQKNIESQPVADEMSPDLIDKYRRFGINIYGSPRLGRKTILESRRAIEFHGYKRSSLKEISSMIGGKEIEDKNWRYFAYRRFGYQAVAKRHSLYFNTTLTNEPFAIWIGNNYNENNNFAKVKPRVVWANHVMSDKQVIPLTNYSCLNSLKYFADKGDFVRSCDFTDLLFPPPVSVLDMLEQTIDADIFDSITVFAPDRALKVKCSDAAKIKRVEQPMNREMADPILVGILVNTDTLTMEFYPILQWE